MYDIEMYRLTGIQRIFIFLQICTYIPLIATQIISQPFYYLSRYLILLYYLIE